MSDAFLAKCAGQNDVKPGLIRSKTQQREHDKALKRMANHEEMQRNKKIRKNIGQIEIDARESALAVPLAEAEPLNKGLAMLARMGYKAGDSLGRGKEGRLEPVEVQVKVGRGGLGRDTALREIGEQKCRILEERHRAEVAAFDPAAFRLQMRGKLESRRSEWDLYRAQKSCRDLDEKKISEYEKRIAECREKQRKANAANNDLDEVKENKTFQENKSQENNQSKINEEETKVEETKEKQVEDTNETLDLGEGVQKSEEPNIVSDPILDDSIEAKMKEHDMKVEELMEVEQKVKDYEQQIKEYSLPPSPWFWPPSKTKLEEEVDDDEEKHEVAKLKDVTKHDGDEEEEEEEPEAEDVFTSIEKLGMVEQYLRTTHCYCLHCGIQFEHEFDMQETCPGPGREQHD